MAEQHPAMSCYRRYSLLLPALVAGIAAYLTLERGQHIMNPNAFASSPNVSKPLIDTLASKQIATATFGMG
jgi:hypothetical protein